MLGIVIFELENNMPHSESLNVNPVDFVVMFGRPPVLNVRVFPVDSALLPRRNVLLLAFRSQRWDTAPHPH